MGMFSWRSCISGNDIMNTYNELHEGITVVLPNDRVLTGSYDGYGRVGGIDIYDEMADILFGIKDRDVLFKTKGAFKKCEQMIKAMLPSEYKERMRYADLNPSESAEGQGHWFSSYESRVSDDTQTHWDFNEEGDYDIASTYIDEGHTDGIKEYTEREALITIKKILAEDDALLNGRDIESFNSYDLLTIGALHYSIDLKQ
mgnify:CR=1 FL=1